MIGPSTELLAQIINITTAVIDNTGAAAKLEIFGPGRPAIPGGAHSAVKLAQLTFSYPIAAPTVAPIQQLLPIVGDPMADASGDGNWARISKSNGEFVMDVDVSDLFGAGEVRFPSIAFQKNAFVGISSGTISVGGQS